MNQHLSINKTIMNHRIRTEILRKYFMSSCQSHAMKLSLVLTLLAATTTVGDEPNPLADTNRGPSVGLVNEENLAAEISEQIIDGIAAVRGDSKTASLLDIVKRLRPYGYGIVSEALVGGRSGTGRSSRGAGQSGGHGAPMDDAQMKARFDSFDRNRDGVWKGSEINQYMSTHALGADGEVTYEEYKKAWAEIRGGRGGQRGGGQRGGGQRGGGQRGGGRDQRGSGAGQRGGHGHGGGSRPSATERASGDAKFVTSFDVNRDRQVTNDEIRQAVSADVAAGLNPQPDLKADSTSARPVELSERGRNRIRQRMLARGRAIRAVLILSDLAKPKETVDATILQSHVAEKSMMNQLWNSIAGGKKAIASKSLYQSLTRVPEGLLSELRH